MDGSHFVSLDRLVYKVKKAGRDARQIREEFVDYDNEDVDPVQNSPIYALIEEGNKWQELTNFSRTTVETIWRPFDAAMKAERHRGAPPKTSTMDHLLLYLIWLKSGMAYATMASLFSISATMMEDNVNRARIYLLETLRGRWWSNRPRPRFFNDGILPPYGLIIDGHTAEIGRPVLPFEEAKRYWDGHNKIYGVKVEVAVTATFPHYCMFVSHHVPGSMHDYELHKAIFEDYVPYLTMTDSELARRPAGSHHRFWDIMADKGYCGSNDDTEPIRRIVPARGKLDEEQAAMNNLINNKRVVVEAFFGRVADLWCVMRHKWHYDFAHFDADITIAMLITNYHIEETALHEDDQDFYIKLVNHRRRLAEEKAAKKAASVRSSKLARKQKREESAALHMAQQAVERRMDVRAELSPLHAEPSH